MPSQFFVTGTDTGVGKTFISEALLLAANDAGCSTLGLKPIAAGCINTPDGLRNDDALTLQRAMSLELAYECINPVALEPAIAPHVAAQLCQQQITLDQLIGSYQQACELNADFTLIEGAGGWRVPLNDQETLAHLPKALELPVIMVVGIRLGCLNHAQLTAEAILNDGLPLVGWVANEVDGAMSHSQESIEFLKASLSAPCIGHIPFQSSPEAIKIKTCLDIEKLLV